MQAKIKMFASQPLHRTQMVILHNLQMRSKIAPGKLQLGGGRSRCDQCLYFLLNQCDTLFDVDYRAIELNIPKRRIGVKLQRRADRITQTVPFSERSIQPRTHTAAEDMVGQQQSGIGVIGLDSRRRR
jgi:hypothetical protein